MQTGTGQTAHTKNLIFPWATGTTLAAAINTALGVRGVTWAAYFSPSNSALATPNLKQPLIRIVTAATNGTLGDGTGTFPLVTNQPYGPYTTEDTSTLTYVGDASASVHIEC